MLYDIHHDLGPKKRLASYEHAFAAVRAIWPGARSEGSTGFQRSFWIGPASDAELVGHAWRCEAPRADGG
jgi:hypothetical protein